MSKWTNACAWQLYAVASNNFFSPSDVARKEVTDQPSDVPRKATDQRPTQGHWTGHWTGHTLESS